MTRIGWTVMALFTLVAGAFGLLQTGPSTTEQTGREAPRATLLQPAPVQKRADVPRRPIGAFSGRFTIPVQGVRATQLIDTWHQSREAGARQHEGLDIPAPRGTPVLAAMAGTVEKLFESARGGTTLYIRSHDGRVMCYYAHLQRYADGLLEGQAVEQGQQVAFVGDTGDAGAGNTHLHFAFNRMSAGEKWYQGVPYDPYPQLRATTSGR